MLAIPPESVPQDKLKKIMATTKRDQAVSLVKLNTSETTNRLSIEIGDNEEVEEDLEGLGIEEVRKVKDKRRFMIRSQQVIKVNRAFGQKKLCDSLSFTAGHACSFGCTYCYVPPMLARNKRLIAIKNKTGGNCEGFIVDIADAPARAREFLTIGGHGKSPKYTDPKDKRVIFASPLVDVAGTMDQVETTVAICLEILQLTNWQIRLLSKSSLLKEVAKGIPEVFQERMIFGLSTGTFDPVLAGAIEKGTSSVTKRLETLHWLQEHDFRTFAMLCPILPQKDFHAFARQFDRMQVFNECEHVWAEALNARGGSMAATIAALRQAGRQHEADLIVRIDADDEAWQDYAEQAFVALTRFIPPEKLRFLQYTTRKAEFERWEKHQESGAVLLDVTLDSREEAVLADCDAKILTNLQGFSDVVTALKTIKDLKLYRSYGTFEEFCLSKYDFARAHGHRLVKAAEVVQALTQIQKKGKTSPDGDILLPTTEAQARELAKILDPKQQLEVLTLAFKKAKSAGKVPLNSKFIQLAAAEITNGSAKQGTTTATYYVPKTYTTDLHVFLGWVANLKTLAKQKDNKSMVELTRQLETVEQEQAILPRDPQIYYAGWKATERERPSVSADFPDMVKFTASDIQHGWMNNESEHDVEHDGQIFSPLGLYYWLRFAGHPEIQDDVVLQIWPEDTERVAKKHRQILGEPDEKTDVQLMRRCLRLKLQEHQYLVKKLMATGDKLLVADFTANPHGDALFWGMMERDGQWIGQNWLGRIWMELRAERPVPDQKRIDADRQLIDKANRIERLRLYGKNTGKTDEDEVKNDLAYWTDIDLWVAERRSLTKRRPLKINVTSNAKADEFNFQKLSPMLLGKVQCYGDVTAMSPEVAWQYSKCYATVRSEAGKDVATKVPYFTMDDQKRLQPTKAWFDWRDENYQRPQFAPDHPDFDPNKDKIRRAFPKHSSVAFWYWNGEVITDRTMARQKIYAPLYIKAVQATAEFKRLREIFEGRGDEPGRDLLIFDFDGYDWTGLGMQPEDCIQDVHSFGHGMCCAFLLLGIDPTTLTIEQKSESPVPDNAPLLLDWESRYDSYPKWNHKPNAKRVAKNSVGQKIKIAQPKMSDSEKANIEKLTLKILGLDPAKATKGWGTAHPPGRYAQTVIRVSMDAAHRFSQDGKPIGVKIYKATPDGRSASVPMLDFHRNKRTRLPGLKENKHVQDVLYAGIEKGEDGKHYHFLIQHWVEGETLEDRLNGKTMKGKRKAGLSGEAMGIMDDLFNELIIPLWSAKTAYWDVRISNYVFTPEGQTIMIDSDTLGANVMEILYYPGIYKRRNKSSQTAMLRYMHMAGEIAVQCLSSNGGNHTTSIYEQVEDRFATYLEPVFVRPYPLVPDWLKKSKAAYSEFRKEFVRLLSPGSSPVDLAGRQLKKMQRPDSKKKPKITDHL
ncbi:MAG: NADAR family protein [Negativicutes bacterium]|nr:NADAR family protein [Negativicutes bacterium]